MGKRVGVASTTALCFPGTAVSTAPAVTHTPPKWRNVYSGPFQLFPSIFDVRFSGIVMNKRWNSIDSKGNFPFEETRTCQYMIPIMCVIFRRKQNGRGTNTWRSRLSTDSFVWRSRQWHTKKPVGSLSPNMEKRISFFRFCNLNNNNNNERVVYIENDSNVWSMAYMNEYVQ